MRLLTWNVNSIRLRMDSLPEIVRALDPDTMCFQETKAEDTKFPFDAIESLGFPHIATSGMAGYNGVAIVSKRPLADIVRRRFCDRDDCRHIAARIDGIAVHNLYIPAGGDLPDPDTNPKFAHKLAFLDELCGFAATLNPEDPTVFCGDFNIAPLETDVWSHKQLLKVVSHTPVEVDRLDALQKTLPFSDAVRAVIPAERKLFSWWSYRARDWRASNRGRRLDHIWVGPALADRVRHAEIFDAARDFSPCSDHAPVLAVFD